MSLQEQTDPCPQCGSGSVSREGERYRCWDCGHRWDPVPPEARAEAVRQAARTFERRAQRMSERLTAWDCLHPQEPAKPCPCPANCYCRRDGGPCGLSEVARLLEENKRLRELAGRLAVALGAADGWVRTHHDNSAWWNSPACYDLREKTILPALYRAREVLGEEAGGG